MLTYHHSVAWEDETHAVLARLAYREIFEADG